VAREYAYTRVDIWGDDDWRGLTFVAQELYHTLHTSPGLSHVGVADWWPERIASRGAAWTVELVEAAGRELEDALYFVIDRRTREVLLREFIRTDGIMKQPKMAVSVANAYASTESSMLRGVIVHELQKLREDQPDLPGWKAERAAALLSKKAVDPATYPLREASDGGFLKGFLMEALSGLASGSSAPNGTPKATPNGLGSDAPKHPAPAPAPAPPPAPADGRQQTAPSSVSPLVPKVTTVRGGDRRISDYVGIWSQSWQETLTSVPSDTQATKAGEKIRGALDGGNDPELVADACRVAGAKGVPWVDDAIAEITRGRVAAANAPRVPGQSTWDKPPAPNGLNGGPND
jgi:hypothetical protein